MRCGLARDFESEDLNVLRIPESVREPAIRGRDSTSGQQRTARTRRQRVLGRRATALEQREWPPTGPAPGQRSAKGFPCLAAEPTLNVAVTAERDELDAEGAPDCAAGGAQRPADAAGELMAALDVEADEAPEEGV